MFSIFYTILKHNFLLSMSACVSELAVLIILQGEYFFQREHLKGLRTEYLFSEVEMGKKNEVENQTMIYQKIFSG